MRGVPNNLLLAGLAAPVRAALLRDLEPLVLRFGEQLCTPDDPAAHAVFPIDCSISLMLDFVGEPSVEAGLIGFEGMVGVPLLLGAPFCAVRAFVQGPGRAWRVDGARLARALGGPDGVRERLNRYACARMLQLAHAARCRSFHGLDGRLARWLLMSRDRARSDELALTHEFLAQMLGVRRAGVTIAARALHDRRILRYARGRITVLDPERLAAAACACYAAEKRIYARLMR